MECSSHHNTGTICPDLIGDLIVLFSLEKHISSLPDSSMGDGTHIENRQNFSTYLYQFVYGPENAMRMVGLDCFDKNSHIPSFKLICQRFQWQVIIFLIFFHKICVKSAPRINTSKKEENIYTVSDTERLKLTFYLLES